MFFKNYWILWQNARNLLYIWWYNTKISKSLADSKLKTKEFLKLKWVNVPETLFILKEYKDLNYWLFDLLVPPFVVKPNQWFWWKWILIIVNQNNEWDYLTNNDLTFTKKQLIKHFWDILDWFYSLSWNKDKVLIERKIELDEEIELLWKFWLPDIRVITFNMVPIMAMLRIPTKESWWKANLHSWACWVWIDIWTGKLTYITSNSKILKSISWIGDIRWIILPHWDKVLTLAVKVQQITNIWYIGCDIVLDKIEGPLLLEMNVRPWLEVQIANMSALKTRLERVEWIYVNTIEKWVRLWRDLFSWDIEEKIKNISWKNVLWNKEYIDIHFLWKTYKYLSDIKPNNPKTYIDRNFIKWILKIQEDELNIWSIKLNIDILWTQKKVKFIIKDLLWVNIILWLNSLKWFLIDPFKYKKWELPISSIWLNFKLKNIAIERNYKEQLSKIDAEIINIDRKLNILKYFTPLNASKERKKFIQSKWEYNPKLSYLKIDLDFEYLEKKLKKIDVPDIPLAKIYKLKLKETTNKLKLLKSSRDWVYTDFTNLSKSLYWKINPQNLEYVSNILKNKLNFDIRNDTDYMTFDEMHTLIKKFNHIYWINIKFKTRSVGARFVMKGDILFVRESVKIARREFRAILSHELEWHYLRWFNGRKLWYSIFSYWTSKYLEIDEWIAIYNQNRFLTTIDSKYYSPFERYYFIDFADNNSYKKLLLELLKYYDYNYSIVFNYILRLKRWVKSFSSDWIFFRDSIYINWFFKVEAFLNSWNKLNDLYMWKISIEDLEILKDTYILKINYSDIRLPLYL